MLVQSVVITVVVPIFIVFVNTLSRARASERFAAALAAVFALPLRRRRRLVALLRAHAARCCVLLRFVVACCCCVLFVELDEAIGLALSRTGTRFYAVRCIAKPTEFALRAAAFRLLFSPFFARGAVRIAHRAFTLQ